MKNPEKLFKKEVIKIEPHVLGQEIYGDICFLKNDEISIDFVDLYQKDIYKTHVNKKEEHFEIHFELQGIIDYKSKFDQDLKTLSGRYDLFYKPEIEGEVSFIPINEKRKAIGIDLSIDYIKSVFGGDMDVLGDFWKNIEIQKDDYWIENAVIDSELQHLLYQIENCPYQGVMKSVFLQSKVNELLMYVVHQRGSSMNRKASSLSHKDKERLYYACELIRKNFENPLTLKELSIRIGMSESKFKRDFKTLFGMTAFQYLMEQRMQKAKQLLLESDYNIAEISDIVGYKNPTHFTFAFKKFYNRLPSDFKL